MRNVFSFKNLLYTGLLLGVCGPDAFSQSVSETYRERVQQDVHRPSYHFTPPAFWLNDPNGLVHYKGMYHLFYQYSIRPEGPDAVKHWGHAVSRDMLHWEHLPPALSPVAGGPDSVGVWSGSALRRGDTVMLYYTSVFPESQSVAFNTDDSLIRWKKYPGNPIIATPPAGTPVISFRDPTVWRDGDTWMMGIGSGVSDNRGAVLAYESDDLVDWKYCGPLYVDENKEFSYVFECPTFMPMSGGLHLLLYSGHVRNGRTGASYMLGKYADKRFTPVTTGVVDVCSDFYAAQGFKDERGRTLVFGWLKPARSGERLQEAGWSGAVSFPRELAVDKQGGLIIRPAEELEKLRGRHTAFKALRVAPGVRNILGAVGSDQAELIVRFDTLPEGRHGASRFGIVVRRSSKTKEETRIYYDVRSKKLELDRRTSSLDEHVVKDIQSGDLVLARGEPLVLRIFIDRSVVEVFANDRVVGTVQVYPTDKESTEIDLFAEGGEIGVSSVDMWRFNEGSLLADAVGLWNFSSGEPSDGSGLSETGAVKSGESLQGWQSDASLAHGGDGKVALLEGGYFSARRDAVSAGSRIDSAFALYVRLLDRDGNWNYGVLSERNALNPAESAYDLYFSDRDSLKELVFDLNLEGRMEPVQVRTSVRPLAPQVWTHDKWRDIVVVFDGGELTVFIDGIECASVPARGSVKQFDSSDFFIGTTLPGAKPFKGSIDHVALWDYAPTKDQIRQLSLKTHEEELGMADESVENAAAEVQADPYRPIYHVAPKSRFMNDPNGPVYYNGEYHLFFQHIPYYTHMNHNIPAPGWGHVVSKDLVHWKHLPIAMMPLSGTYDAEAIASGACVIHEGVPTMVYTSVPPQAQSVAKSYDGLRTWVRYAGNPVVSELPAIDSLDTGFRDPYLWKEDGYWYMIVGSGINGTGGTVLSYRSRDLLSWEYVGPLCIGDEKACFQWECPNFFDLGDRHMLVVSPLQRDAEGLRADVVYSIGEYDKTRHKFHPGAWKKLDWGGPGRFYAPNSMADAEGRRILWGWCALPSFSEAPWNGVLSIPRVLSIDDRGELRMSPLPELAELRKEHWHFDKVKIGKASKFEVLEEVSGDALEIVATVETDGRSSFGLEVLCSDDFQESVPVEIDLSGNTFKVGNEKGTLSLTDEEKKTIRLHVFIDKSIIEVFVNDKECLTTFVKPSQKGQHVRLFTRGKGASFRTVDVWELGGIWDD